MAVLYYSTHAGRDVFVTGTRREICDGIIGEVTTHLDTGQLIWWADTTTTASTTSTPEETP